MPKHWAHRLVFNLNPVDHNTVLSLICQTSHLWKFQELNSSKGKNYVTFETTKSKNVLFGDLQAKKMYNVNINMRLILT